MRAFRFLSRRLPVSRGHDSVAAVLDRRLAPVRAQRGLTLIQFMVVLLVLGLVAAAVVRFLLARTGG